jgi:acetyl-CoA carboxylase biotin carboxyl carrier protein
MMAEDVQPDSAQIVGLIDRLEELLNASELSEIEIEAGETALVLRKPSAFAAQPAGAGSLPSSDGRAGAAPAAPAEDGPPQNAVLAPLTGLYYSSPSPGAQPYTSVGAQITVGQVIGLIEAMKLFNEIKSDRAGTVVRMHAKDGALVKAKQPLIEVE